MAARPIVEFRDPDGTYVLVRPLDSVRGVVLDGTLHEQGQILYKRASVSWKRASSDIGGATFLSPRDLVAVEADESESPLSGLPDTDQDVFDRAHRAIERRSRRDDPREALTLEGPEEAVLLNEAIESFERDADEIPARNRRKLRSA